MIEEFPADWLPAMTWPRFMYKQQLDFIYSDTWQTWFIGGNGTGKTLVFYENMVMHMLGIHPCQLGPPPIKVRILVPSFDNVQDVALEKLQNSQRILFTPPFSPEQEEWFRVLEKYNALLDYKPRKGELEIGPILPKSQLIAGKEFKKEHRSIELKNGSSIHWTTTEQGWMNMRGGEQDILGSDEEGGEREFDELKRGLRNAKGGGKIYGAMTPPYKEGQGPTWTKTKVYDMAPSDDDITAINACMADNPAITDEYIKRFSQGKTKSMIDVQIYGKYPNWGDLVHPDFQDRLWDAKKVDGHLLRNDTPMPSPRDVDWVMAFDWHPSKPCAAVFGFKDRDGNITFFDELDEDFAKEKTIDDLAEAFRQIEGHPHTKREFKRWQDPSAKAEYKAVQRGFNAWDAFRKVGIITSAGKNRDPGVGVGIVNEYFRGNGKDEPRIFIYERCKYLRQYLTNHYWKRGADGVGKPDPKWSDYPICVRYILQEIGWKRGKDNRRKWPMQSFGKSESKRHTIQLEV